MQSSNPAISVLRQNAGAYNFGGIEQGATISGTTTKSLLLVALTLVVGYVAMSYTLGQIFYAQHMPTFLIYGSLIAAVVVAFITIFKPTAAPITAPIYAILEGCALGSVSAMFVMNMLALWKFKIIVPTQRFKSIITGAMGGIFVLYLINIVVSLFGGSFLPQTGPLSIIISLVVCTVAAFSLVLDFENIQVACDEGLPKHFEYYNAFSLLVTICWLYIEILKLLSKRE